MDRARTVVVSGVPGHVLSPSRTVDKLIVHFQTRRKSHGGDVSTVTYPTSNEGVAFVTFDRPEDAERVTKKERQILTDSVFREDYDLTVFPFSDDVFLYVSTAKVDLSWFDGCQLSLIEKLRLAHRSLRFQPVPKQKAATVEGPFAAVQALRTDLFNRVESLKTGSVKFTGANLNPKVLAHPEASVSSAAFKSKEPTASGSLSGLPQRTGEARETQSLLSKGETPNDYLVQTASGGTLAKSLYDRDVDDRLKTSTKHRTNSLNRQVVGEERNPRLIPSLSDQKLLPDADVKRQKGIPASYVQRDKYSPSKYVTGLSNSDVTSRKVSTRSNVDVTKRIISPEGQQDVWLDTLDLYYRRNSQSYRWNDV